MADPVFDYLEEFGTPPPSQYFDDPERLGEVVADAIEEGEAPSEREWLEAAGYEEEDIDEVLNDSAVV